jgi:hypothetical protein
MGLTSSRRFGERLREAGIETPFDRTAYEVEQDMETFLNVNLLTSAEHTMLYQFGAALATELRKLKQYGPTQPTIY